MFFEQVLQLEQGLSCFFIFSFALIFAQVDRWREISAQNEVNFEKMKLECERLRHLVSFYVVHVLFSCLPVSRFPNFFFCA